MSSLGRQKNRKKLRKGREGKRVDGGRLTPTLTPTLTLTQMEKGTIYYMGFY